MSDLRDALLVLLLAVVIGSAAGMAVGALIYWLTT